MVCCRAAADRPVSFPVSWITLCAPFYAIFTGVATLFTYTYVWDHTYSTCLQTVRDKARTAIHDAVLAQAEGEQQFGPWVGMAPLIDKPDLLQVRAPNPTQVLLTTRDQYFPLNGGLAAFKQSLPAFEALAPAGQPPALSVCVGNNSHGYINRTRLCLYQFLSVNLLYKDDSGVEISDDHVQTLNFSQIRVALGFFHTERTRHHRRRTGLQ